MVLCASGLLLLLLLIEILRARVIPVMGGYPPLVVVYSTNTGAALSLVEHFSHMDVTASATLWLLIEDKLFRYQKHV